MTESVAQMLQADLLDLFHGHEPEINVAVCLWCRSGEWGVSIISQDPEVDAYNVGKVVAQ